MLLQIRKYIARAGVVSTQHLSREFHLDITALLPILDIWVNKGVIRKCEEKTNCKSACIKCRTSTEYYQYLL